MILAFLLVFWAAPRRTWGQAAWEYTPYDVQVWVIPPNCPEWTARQEAELQRLFQSRAEAAWGAVWNLRVSTAPPEVQRAATTGLKPLDFALLKAAGAPLNTADKLYLVQLQLVDGLWGVHLLELDCRTRQWGEPETAAAVDAAAAIWSAWDLMVRAFTPLVRIERVEALTVTARIRAGGLIVSDNSPALIQPEQSLRPIVRRNERTGEPTKTGLLSVGWTILAVESRAGSLLTCKMSSAYRAPVPTKIGLRTERLALLVRSHYDETTVLIRSRDPSKTPLVGYSLYERPVGDEPAVLVGVSDWKGEVLLPSLGGKSQVLLVRSGDQLLARLPLVPGALRHVEAPMVNDDGRLQAEGLVRAFQSRIMDVEARRQILAARTRARMGEGKLDDAQKLLDELRQIETRSDLSRYLNQQRVASPDPITQKRIDKLLSDASGLLAKFVDPELVSTLNRDLVNARNPPPAKPAPKTAPPKTAPPAAPAAPGTTTTPPPAPPPAAPKA